MPDVSLVILISVFWTVVGNSATINGNNPTAKYKIESLSMQITNNSSFKC